MFVLAAALKAGYDIERLYELTAIDRWFLRKMQNIVAFQLKLEESSLRYIDNETMLAAKQLGFSDKQIAQCIKSTELAVRNSREKYSTFLILHNNKILGYVEKWRCIH